MMVEKLPWDTFFYHGEELDDDIRNDIIIGVVQSKRSFFFNRQDSAGVSSKENFPDSLSTFIGIQYAVAKWVGYRNSYVSDQDPDQRVATSQFAITTESNKQGKLSVKIPYISFKDQRDLNIINIPIME
jgi:hypothetical protein